MKYVEICQEAIFLAVTYISLLQADYAPYFYDNAPNSTNGNMAMLSIPEDTPIGSHLYTLNGTDPEGNSVTYDMTFEPGTKHYFAVEPQTGNVTLLEELDREKEDEIEVLVGISDSVNKVVEKVQILVTDANDECPVFINTPYIINVPEDTPSGTSIFKVYAVDKDTGSGGSVTYFLQNTRKNKFSIDRYSGVLRLKSSVNLDFERSTGHFVTVTAKDGGGKLRGKHRICSSSTTVTINVLDIQDTPPMFSGTPYFGFVYEDTEPGSEIFNVIAYDGDRGNPNLIHYTIAHGNDGSFDINSTTGAITLLQATELLQKDIYKLLIQANDADSEIWGDVKYSIYGTGADLFLIHPSTGIIYTQPWAVLDAEVQSRYNFNVKAADVEGKHSLAEVFVTVLDVNDHYPEFNEDILEKVMIIGLPVKVEAKDEDAEEPNNIVDYSITQADPANVFDIDQATGEIVLKSYIKSLEVIHNITRNKDCQWSLVVQAKDRGSPSFSTTAVVRIDITEETSGKGHMADFLLQSKDNPMKILGVLAGIVCFFVMFTILISTIMFWRNKKSNRVGPVRRIIKKRPYHRSKTRRSKWFQNKKSGKRNIGFTVSEANHNLQDGSARCNCPPLPLPCAPLLPPQPFMLPTSLNKPDWVLPTVSGSLSSKVSHIPQQSKCKVSNINSALVSELKQRFEQRKNEDASKLYL
ncbi:cadherin-related family member 1 [Rhincodon typus]|uniref:cadherin-related family member 1 n=1 Tax=Rhincodon typus TaxID=259920 RepID=UPI00202F66D3|nr:cadherin-related family member 1 [Rhincodon typus]